MKASPLPIPAGMSRKFQGNQLVITRCWRKMERVSGTIGVAVVWNAFVILSLMSGRTKWIEDSAVPAYFESTLGRLVPDVFVGIGLFLVYYAVATLVNSTRVEITASMLRVTTGPLPWHPERRITTREVADVIYREKASKGYATIYRVIAVLSDGREKRLLGGISDYEATVYYVREIRSVLKLPDLTLSPDA